MVMSGPNGWVMPDIHIPNITIPEIAIPRMTMSWQSARLGIVGESMGQEEQLADFFGVKEGVLVKSVSKNSAAEKAGIKAGDVIVKVGDSKVTNTEEITRALRGLNQGRNTLTVTVIRNKKETPLSVTIEGAGNGTLGAIARLVAVQGELNAKIGTIGTAIDARISAQINAKISAAVARTGKI